MNSGEFTPAAVIARKRDGLALSDSELDTFIDEFVACRVTDYQMTAFLMAAFLRGLSGSETAALTRAMAASGARIDLSDVPGTKVDKHSTGGVGDKVSLPLAPLVAACGVPVPMISGRGLGHTGGTLDKLESIPGFRTQLSTAEFTRILREVGCVMGGQTAEIAPADRRMYALRDVTATVESIPLIVSSILSKKIAEGTDALVLDVKFGRGAFMPERARAAELARELARVGDMLGLSTMAFLTDMDRPLGRTIGNAVEVEESIEILKGSGPADLKEITVVLGSAMLIVGGAAADFTAARRLIENAIATGQGLDRFRRLIELQGGDPSVVDHPDRLPRAPAAVPYESPVDGFVGDIDPRRLALAVVAAGGGRRRAEDTIDPAAGIRLHVSLGSQVRRGQPVLTLLGREAGALKRLLAGFVEPAVRIDPAPPAAAPLIASVIYRGREVTWAGDETPIV